MARKRTASMEAAAAAAVAAVAAQQDDNPDVLELEDDAVADDVLEGLRRMEQGGNRVTWYVYCDALDREGYIEKLRTEQLDEELFKKRYGPGEYRVFGRSSDGHYVKGSHKIIKISGVMTDPKAAAPGGGDAVAMLREMRATDEARASKRADDWRGIATLVATPVATVLAALIARPRPPPVDIAALVTALRPQQSTLSEMTTALVNLKAMNGDGGGGGSVEVVLKVLERLQDLPSGGGEGGWLGIIRDVIREAAPPVRELLGKMGQGAAQPGQLPPGAMSGPAFGPGVQPSLPRPPHSGNGATAPTNTALPPSQSLPAASTQPTAETTQPLTEASNMFALAEPWLRRKAEDLHEYASTNMDCALVAELLLESARKKFGGFVTAPQLAELLQASEWWPAVAGFHPPLAPYQAWCDDVRHELLGLLNEEMTGAPPDEGAAQGT
jgi:hypothetical protein